MKQKLDKRLQAVASLVRKDAVLADVGSDHAFLPIYLIQQGKISAAVASDINEGPIASAKKNVAANGLTDCISLVCTDGLHGIETYCPTDVVIAGMGGELIAQILSQAPFVCDPSIRLILQPMSRQEKLRAFLAQNGFLITQEVIVDTTGRLYQIICAVYDGVVRTLPLWQCYAGIPDLANDRTLYNRYLQHLEKTLLSQLSGLRKGALTEKSAKEIAETQTLLQEIQKEIHDENN